MKNYSVMLAVLLMAGGCAHQGGMSGTESSSSSSYSRTSDINNDANNRTAPGQRQFGTSASNGGAVQSGTSEDSSAPTGQNQPDASSGNSAPSDSKASDQRYSSSSTLDSSGTKPGPLNDSAPAASSSDLSRDPSGSSEPTQPGASPADPYKSSSSSTTSTTQSSASGSTAPDPDSPNAIPAEGGFGTSQTDRATSDSSAPQSSAYPLNSNQATDKAANTYQRSVDSSASRQNDPSEGSPATTQSGAGTSSTYPAIDAGSAAATSQVGTSDSGSTSDRALAAKIKSMLMRDTGGINGPTQSEVRRNVKITANNGRITLRGTVSGERDKKILETRVREMEGVQSVDNQLAVSPLAIPATRDSATGAPAPGSTGESKDSSSQDAGASGEKSNNSSSSSDNQPK